MTCDEIYRWAAREILAADAILVTAGAGMGVDSGLPDFRGQQGFWKAYPPFARLGLSFSEVANPKWFFQRPAQAWGFYGHRYQLYSRTRPHAGYDILKKWMQPKRQPGFVFTSNVDGHFQRSGFEPNRIVECHGSLNHWQCNRRCTDHIGKMSDFMFQVDEATFLAEEPLPKCAACGDLARPNVLMFGDAHWIDDRTQKQFQRYQYWRKRIAGCRLLILEIGAGNAVPTVRWESESREGQLVRINPRDAEVPPGGIGIAAGGLEALKSIDAEMDAITNR